MNGFERLRASQALQGLINAELLHEEFNANSFQGLSALYRGDAVIDTTMINNDAYTTLAAVEVIGGKKEMFKNKAAAAASLQGEGGFAPLKSLVDADKDVWDAQLSGTGAFLKPFKTKSGDGGENKIYLVVQSALPGAVMDELRDTIDKERMTWNDYFTKSPLHHKATELSRRNAHRLLAAAAEHYGCRIKTHKDLDSVQLEELNGAQPNCALPTISYPINNLVWDRKDQTARITYGAAVEGHHIANGKHLLAKDVNTPQEKLYLIPMSKLESKNALVSSYHHGSSKKPGHKGWNRKKERRMMLEIK